MSRLVGTELDTTLYERLAGRDLARMAGKALVMITLDESGCPHPALLSYFEVVAKDRANIRLATYRDTTAARNARRQGKVTLAIYDDRLACYVKGTVTELAPAMASAPENAKLNIRVDRVLSDDPDPRFASEAHVTGGVTYHEPAPELAHARSGRVIAELLE